MTAAALESEARSIANHVAASEMGIYIGGVHLLDYLVLIF